jgi:hypothetical protein
MTLEPLLNSNNLTDIRGGRSVVCETETGGVE